MPYQLWWVKCGRILLKVSYAGRICHQCKGMAPLSLCWWFSKPWGSACKPFLLDFFLPIHDSLAVVPGGHALGEKNYSQKQRYLTHIPQVPWLESSHSLWASLTNKHRDSHVPGRKEWTGCYSQEGNWKMTALCPRSVVLLLEGLNATLLELYKSDF